MSVLALLVQPSKEQLVDLSPGNPRVDFAPQLVQRWCARELPPQLRLVLVVVSSNLLIAHIRSRPEASVNKIQHRELPLQNFSQVFFNQTVALQNRIESRGCPLLSQFGDALVSVFETGTRIISGQD